MSDGEVAARVGLAEQLAPDVVAGEDPRHPAPALLLGAVRHQRRPDEADAGRVRAAAARRARRAPRCRSRSAPATRRARRTRPASGCRPSRPACERALPLAQHLGFLGRRRDVDRRAAGARPATRSSARNCSSSRTPRRAVRPGPARRVTAARRRGRELEVQLLEAAEQVDRRVLVAARAGRAVRRLRDP